MEEGTLEGVLGVHGIHVWPALPAGLITSRVSVLAWPVRGILRAVCRAEGQMAWLSSMRGRTSEPLGRVLLPPGRTLAEHLAHCCLSRKKRQSAPFYKLNFCRRLLSMKEKQVKTSQLAEPCWDSLAANSEAHLMAPGRVSFSYGDENILEGL